MRYIDSFRFLSSSLDSLVKAIVDNNHKTLKILKEIVYNVDILHIVRKWEEEIELSKI